MAKPLRSIITNKNFADHLNLIFKSFSYCSKIEFKDSNIELDPLISSGENIFKIEFFASGPYIGIEIFTFGSQKLLNEIITFDTISFPELCLFDKNYNFLITDFYGVVFGFNVTNPRLENFEKTRTFCPLTDNVLFENWFKRNSSELSVWEHLVNLNCGLSKYELSEILGNWDRNPFQKFSEISEEDKLSLTKCIKSHLYESYYGNPVLDFYENRKICKNFKNKFWVLKKFVEK